VCDASATSDSFEQIGAMLAMGLFDCCVVLQVHSGGGDEDFFTSVSFRRHLLAWVSGGGTVLFHGERNVTQAFGWFGKPWRFTNYLRTVHHCFATGPESPHCCRGWYPEVVGAVVHDVSVKACLLSDVPPHEILFGSGTGAVSQSMVFAPQELDPGMCAVAVGEYGAGYVGFFGDVNAEDSTQQIVATLALGPSSHPYPWIPNRACYRRCPRAGKRVVVTVLLAAARLAENSFEEASNDDGAFAGARLPAMPSEVWYHVLRMLPTLWGPRPLRS